MKLARLRNWATGPTVPLSPYSEVVQFILDAAWYNWSWQHRQSITRDVEASNVVWVTPTRLGAYLQFPCRNNERKETARVFICLYDRRVIKAHYFQLQTYKDWFQNFCANIEQVTYFFCIKIDVYFALRNLTQNRKRSMIPTQNMKPIVISLKATLPQQ